MPLKGNQSNTQRVMEIAADVIANKVRILESNADTFTCFFVHQEMLFIYKHIIILFLEI